MRETRFILDCLKTPRLGTGADDLDEEKSGVYLIKSLHHFFVIGSDDVQSFKTSMRVLEIIGIILCLHHQIWFLKE